MKNLLNGTDIATTLEIDGESFIYDMYVEPVVQEDTGVVGLTSVCTDITQRKRPLLEALKAKAPS